MSPVIPKHLESQFATIDLEAVSVFFFFFFNLVFMYLGSKKNQDQSHFGLTFQEKTT